MDNKNVYQSLLLLNGQTMVENCFEEIDFNTRASDIARWEISFVTLLQMFALGVSRDLKRDPFPQLRNNALDAQEYCHESAIWWNRHNNQYANNFWEMKY